MIFQRHLDFEFLAVACFYRAVYVQGSIVTSSDRIWPFKVPRAARMIWICVTSAASPTPEDSLPNIRLPVVLFSFPPLDGHLDFSRSAGHIPSNATSVSPRPNRDNLFEELQSCEVPEKIGCYHSHIIELELRNMAGTRIRMGFSASGGGHEQFERGASSHRTNAALTPRWLAPLEYP